MREDRRNVDTVDESLSSSSLDLVVSDGTLGRSFDMIQQQEIENPKEQ